MARFKKDAAARQALAHTVKLADVKAADYDTVFYVGGHGPMWDLRNAGVDGGFQSCSARGRRLAAVRCLPVLGASDSGQGAYIGLGDTSTNTTTRQLGRNAGRGDPRDVELKVE